MPTGGTMLVSELVDELKKIPQDADILTVDFSEALGDMFMIMPEKSEPNKDGKPEGIRRWIHSKNKRYSAEIRESCSMFHVYIEGRPLRTFVKRRQDAEAMLGCVAIGMNWERNSKLRELSDKQPEHPTESPKPDPVKPDAIKPPQHKSSPWESRPRASQILAEAMLQAPDNHFSSKVVESDDEPGTFQVQIAGSAGEYHGHRNFDTRAEGQSYISGFVFGFTVGGGLKEIAEGHPPSRT
jgi:hypothetical protein